MSSNSYPNEIVLLHGLGRSPASMLPMALRLRRDGFAVRRPGYPSTKLRVDGAIAFVRDALHALFPARTIDIVGHSLGGLIAAAILRDPGPLKVGRIIQLGSPNLGSPLANRLGHTWPVRQMCGPALKDLGPHTAHPATCPRIAAIAGIAGLPGINLPGPNDGAVTLQSAHSGAGHTATARVLHTWLPASAHVYALVAAFLRTGNFPVEAR